MVLNRHLKLFLLVITCVVVQDTNAFITSYFHLVVVRCLVNEFYVACLLVRLLQYQTLTNDAKVKNFLAIFEASPAPVELLITHLLCGAKLYVTHTEYSGSFSCSQWFLLKSLKAQTRHYKVEITAVLVDKRGPSTSCDCIFRLL